VKLPSGYYFGITAASAENPDSFETKGFIVSSKVQQQGSGSHRDSPTSYDSLRETSPNNQGWRWLAEEDQVKDNPASSYKTDEARFQDLHDRITVLDRELKLLFWDLTTLRKEQEQRHEELVRWLSPIYNYAESTRGMIEQVERLLKDVKNDIESKDYREHLNKLHHVVREGHATITDNSEFSCYNFSFQTLSSVTVIASHPRFGFFVFLVVASQIVLLTGYIVYRRRRDKQPKKYL
jgi:mannose-binding lectin 1